MSNISSDYMSTEFLKRCFTCKRQIEEMKEIYMYKDMSFCSGDCRYKQMNKDTEELQNHEEMRNNKRGSKNAPPKGNNKVNFVGDA